MFIRVKTINNTPYAYLVETVKGRQKVRKYLGRVYEAEKGTHAVSDVPASGKEGLLLSLVAVQLQQHGFLPTKNGFQKESLAFSSYVFIAKNREAVLKLNEGYLCSFTLQRILTFRKTDDVVKDGRQLASYFLEAGIPVAEEQFVQFYLLC